MAKPAHNFGATCCTSENDGVADLRATRPLMTLPISREPIQGGSFAESLPVPPRHIDPYARPGQLGHRRSANLALDDLDQAISTLDAPSAHHATSAHMK